MKIAYLTNQYPLVRHTFIRREILALESLGVSVARFSIRDTRSQIVDPADMAEYAKTEVILNQGLGKLFFHLLITLFRRPIRCLKALVQTIRFGRRAGGILKHIIYLAEACTLRKRLQEKQIDHVHVHFATNPATVALLCHCLGGPRYSVTIHGPEEWDRPEAISLREKYEQAAFVVAVSDFGRCQVFRWSGREHWHRVHVIRCGVDQQFLQEHPTPVPDTRQLVLVAGLTEQKGHLLLLQALKIVVDHGEPVEILLVGDGPLRLVIESEIQRLSLQKYVRLLGWQNGEQVKEHLRASRALIMPSFAENLPVAMMESLALGRPVLGTYIAGVPELVENNVNGWVVPAGNVQRTAEAIIEILHATTDQLTTMGLRGRNRVLHMHDVEKEAEKLKTLFAQQAYV